jgi:hypothetical protein
MIKWSVIGTIIVLLVSGANLSTIAILDGEKAWVCLLSCNIDSEFLLSLKTPSSKRIITVLICLLVLHWLTNQKEKTQGPCPYHQQNNPCRSSTTVRLQEFWELSTVVPNPDLSTFGQDHSHIQLDPTATSTKSQTRYKGIEGKDGPTWHVLPWTTSTESLEMEQQSFFHSLAEDKRTEALFRVSRVSGQSRSL